MKEFAPRGMRNFSVGASLKAMKRKGGIRG
jgi:hypothetical protein